jgi:hypothetical protein
MAEETVEQQDGFASAMAAFAAEAEQEPPQQEPPKPVVEGEVAKAPEPETPDAEVETPETPTTTDEGKSPALIALEKEIDTLKRESKKERQRADYWMQNYQQRPVPQPEPKPVVTAAPFAEPKPKLSQFETTDQWEEAVFNWVERRTDHAAGQVEKKILEQQAQQQTERLKREEEGRYQAFLDAKTSEGYQKFGQPAFDKVCQELVESGNVTFGSIMHTTLFNLDRYPDVVMELGKNPAEVERISRLRPQKQIYELESLERKIIAREELSKKAQIKTPTKVEAPGQGEDPKQGTDTRKLIQTAKASGNLRDFAKVFQADPTL